MILSLIGYRATGKTTVAKLLAEALNCPWIDSEREIERQAGKTIARIFAEDGEPARRAYLAVVDRMDAYGNVQDVCAGTPKKNDRQHYLDRPHVHGDPHAQAPLMWMCRALLEKSPK